MKRKGATHSEDPMYGASSPLASLHVDKGKGIKYEGADGQRKGNDCEVFLSFRGTDTCKGFTDYLYISLVDAGIHVFRDDKEFRVGEEIGSELAYCIIQSKISIPIISEDYFSSKWCLRKLALMLKCKRSKGQIVLPIFYKVKPSQLRCLIGRFGDVINAQMVVKEWEEALKEVSSLKGWELEKIGDRLKGALVKKVVRKVLKELKESFMLAIPQQLVGIDIHVENILRLIDSEFNGTSIIGIFGMGGIGKTTLAKVLYSKLSSHFENLSFVANIREISRRDGIECLQKQLITDIIGSLYEVSNVDQGINVIKSIFTHRKVLILLDDMDDSSQLNALCGDGSWFEAGSIVIITTRKKSILNMAGASYMYELNELPLDQSLILFSRHAFQKDHPHSGYESISLDIVSTTGRLPLTLEVIGSFLHGKREEVWADTLKQLMKAPPQKVQEKLKICYDALAYEEKQIFLDMACFFVGSSIQSPTYMQESCCFFPENGIERLIYMSIIKVDKDGKLMMHDQMRDLGRAIVFEENRENPQQRSRLWIHEEAERVLSNNGGTLKIEALCLYKYSCRSYKSEQFKELINLRFLQVNGVNFIGDFQNLLPQLRWLEWQACPSDFVAVNFHPKKLVVLNLSWSGISEDWGGWGPLKMAIELRVLNLTHCHSLRRTPDLSTFERLEILILEDCEKLEKIHSSIGDIKTLISLNVKRCKRLEELPAGIGRMEDLRELLLDEIAIQHIPISRGGLMKLETLRAPFCAQFAQLSEFIGSLMSLTQLDLSHSGIKELPESIGFLKKLNTLDASYCASLAWIPSSIGHLASLQRLLLRECCSLTKIPDSIGQLESLIELDLRSTIIVELPESIRNLQNLRILDIRGTNVTKLPSAIAMMEKLQELRCLHIDKSMEKMKDEAIQRAADMETSDRNYAIATVLKEITDSPEMEVKDESMEKMKDESRQRPVDMETSDRNYAVAAVQNVVGIDDHAKQITDLLEMEVTDEVRIIGIYGTDGIGKTTLAKVVYKRISSCFDSCSFLAEVEETTQNSQGIQFLQNKLIRDILERDHEDPSFDETIEDSVDIFHEMKVLIVVDAVEKPSNLHAIVGDPLQWFGPGSRIIVTSQNEEILKEFDSDKARNYTVSELDDGQAFESFCKHAFRMQSSIPDYDGLSKRIVNATEKLPIAIEVIGSFLRGKSVQEWEKMEKSIKARTMNSQKTSVGLEEILDICYKELDQQQKHIFLDIASFISGVDARIASYLWPNCYPSSGCILMPLAKIGENNELQMHRLLRRLGKRIFEQEGSGDPIGRKFYIQEKGKEIVKDHPVYFTAEYFKMMPELRFLKLDNAGIYGNFEGAFGSLRWLCWQRCPLDFSAEDFLLTELVILDLSWSKVTEDWGGWAEIKMKKLKVLNLTGCSDLLITPDFSDYKDLEIMILERCSRLVKLHPSIGHLRRLVSLNLKFCSRLHRLPEELGCATALKELFIDGTSVRQIPISIGNLKQLEILSGSKCFPLTHLPSSICYLTALSELSLEGAKISELPSSLGELLKLRRLSLRDCRCLEKLPYSIGELGSLEELDISATNISELPDSIRKLKSLRVLRMDSSFIREFPGEIGNLTNLEELHASGCLALRGAIPSDIKKLHRLRSLTLGRSSISSLPPEISTISGLLTLDLIQCNEIEQLPKLPPSLICLRVSSKRMKAIPLIENLKKLEELCLSDGGPPPSAIEKIEGLEGLEGLEALKRLEGLEGLEGLKALKRLDISKCKIRNLYGIGQLTSLRSLILSDCDYLSSLPDLSNLTLLKVLEIIRCKMIRQIEGLEKLTLLKKLKISECPAENSVQVRNAIKDVKARSVEKWWHGDFIKQGATSSKRNTEEIPLATSNKKMKKIEDERGEQAAGMETSDRNYAIAAIQNVVGTDDRVKEITDSLEVEVNDESIKEIKNEAGQQPVDMGTSDRNYAIAAVQNVVGIDDRARQITHLLEMEVNDEVRIIGIYGTDGIGKTTLAKAVYKRISSCFDCCSFLTEVEETTQNPCGIQFLQTKLIRDILERDHEDPSFDETIEDFVDIFREMKVLIVVDAVEKPSDLHAIVGDPLHWFGPGSRIIVTSQNEEILKRYDPEKACNYMVDELDDGQAFESFCKHAFRMQSSIPDYDGLSNRIVNATEKLPLAVEVVGSFLRGKSIQEWEKMEKSMKARMMSSQKTTVSLEEILDICYEELGPQQKDIFLDIARFISGVDARIASYMWPDCYPSSGCILMPLAKIGENNELQMHGLPRCLGKRIFKPEGSGDPSSGRFCTQDMVLKAMNKEKGIGEVEARDSCILTAANFVNMPAISFLKLDDTIVSGDFTGAFPSLRWLCWQRCPLDFSAENFVLRELVILDLSWSKVTEDWRGWSEIKMEKLKVLNLTGCSDLLVTPNFSDYKDLEILILEQCSHLVKLDPTIGHLKCLVSLNLKFCSQLNGLPVELGCTTALKELFIDGTSVRQIPISIGNLKQLEILSGLKCLPLTHLPSSICYLAALSELSLDGAKISELPSSLGELLKLRRLSLRDCRCLEKLPYSIGEIASLEELDISATNISELPDSIRKLKSLRVLRMDSSFIRAIPGEIGNLTKLEELHASWCQSLKGAIPGDIEALHCLRSLTLGHSSISSLPPEVSTISGLHTLDLIRCNKIEELPKLPPSLICLRVSSKRMKAIPLLEDMKELEELCLSDGDPKAHRPPSKLPTPESNVKRMIGKPSFSILFPKLRKLELSLSQVIKLKFGLTDGPPLKRPKTLPLPSFSCRDVSELPKKLLAFKLYHSAIEEIEGLEGLEALKRLDISNCKIQNLNGIGQITSLRSLILSECDDLSLPDLSNLKSLKVLEIIRCKMISQIEGLEKLTSLEKLNISECPAEKSVQVQDALKRVMARFPVL